MINLSIGFDMANNTDPAGMCVLYKDENKESHIQNMILGDKADLIYSLLTTPSSRYVVSQIDNHTEIRFKKEG